MMAMRTVAIFGDFGLRIEKLDLAQCSGEFVDHIILLESMDLNS